MNEKITSLIRTAKCRLRPQESPDPRIWIFSSTDNRHFNYNSRYLFLYVKDHCPDIRPRFVINDDAMRAKLNIFYGRDASDEAYFIETKSAAGIRQVLSAGVWFTSAGLPVYGTGLSKGRRIVNLWHGVPLKTIALADRSEHPLQRLYFQKIFSENYTDVAATSPAVSRVMQRSLGVTEEKMRIWGQPRCDVLRAPFDRAVFLRRMYPDLGFQPAKVILYAPTFRSDGPVRLFPFDDFDSAALETFLEREGILLCVRMHPAEETAEPLPPTSHLRYLNEEKLEDICEGLAAFDLLITDYSSIYIDYLLLDRPMIFLPYDLESYRASHGFSFPYEKVTPGEKPATMAAFFEALTRRQSEDPYAARRRKIRRFFHASELPACEMIVQAVREEVFSV